MPAPMPDLTIIGAGAAGLAAAIFAATTDPKKRVVLLDGAESIGAKILISGGGRCNVTHFEVSANDFNGSCNIVRNILAAFDVEATCRWFASLGVELKREETGKLFPVTDSARTVLDSLLRRCSELNVDVRSGHRVREVSKLERGFAVEHSRGQLRAERVVLAAGGCSLPRTGSDGSGWAIARSLGHSVTETYPALVPLVLDTGMFHAQLSGVSQAVELTTFADGKVIDRRRGSMLWTHFGISGPVVLDASRHWVIAKAQGRTAAMRCSFAPGEDFEMIDAWLRDQASQRPRLSLARCLAQRLPERLAALLVQRAGCEAGAALGQLSREQRRAVTHLLTALPLPVVRARGWNFAEVTAGGVPLDEIDYRTMESRKVPGLYLIGEMLDCDGRIGGFNFQWAWATGFLAGRAAGALGHRGTEVVGH
jgi:predicted Rossmann fold flavoprotein